MPTPVSLHFMYLRHFALTQDPFSIAPDPRFLILSDRHREALAHLLYGVMGTGGFVLLTGDIGTGKTTVCRCFLEQIPARCNVAIVFNPKLSVIELLQTICEEFHIAVAAPASAAPSLKSHIDALNAFLLKSHAAGQSNVLIVDEAQNLRPDVLEQLRLLTNLETNERKLLQIVLIGQPELRTMLERPDLEQLAQRVIARFHLEALSETETSRYIQHRLTVAGHSGPMPFDTKTLTRIFQLTRGVPRRINLLCGRALLGAWANGLHRADQAIVEKAAGEVFGPRGNTPVSKRKAYAALAVGVAGLAALAVAASLQFWPRPAGESGIAAASTPAPALASNAVPERTANVGTGSAASTLNAGAAATVMAPVDAPAAATNPGPVTSAIEDMGTLLPKLPRTITPAWRALAVSWKLPETSADPCQAASAQQLQCYSSNDLTIPLLRQLGRPGILTLHGGEGPPVFAVLTGLNEQTATLRVGEEIHRVSLSSLGRLWRGAFATYWRPPPDFATDLRDGSSGAVIARLANQLSTLEGAPVPVDKLKGQTLDNALKARVRAFQKGQGLRPDGYPGPMTLMQIDRALGSSEPSLQVAAP